jgi:hypothetical protein
VNSITQMVGPGPGGVTQPTNLLCVLDALIFQNRASYHFKSGSRLVNPVIDSDGRL